LKSLNFTAVSCSLATALADVVHILMIHIVNELKGSHSPLRFISDCSRV